MICILDGNIIIQQIKCIVHKCQLKNINFPMWVAFPNMGSYVFSQVI